MRVVHNTACVSCGELDRASDVVGSVWMWGIVIASTIMMRISPVWLWTLRKLRQLRRIGLGGLFLREELSQDRQDDM